MAGLTREGFEALRASDFLTIIRERYEAELAKHGLPAPDWGSDLVVGSFSAIMADLLGYESEGQQAIYDAFDVGNAVGIQLSNLARLGGVTRHSPTHSLATVTFSGTAGTVIREGTVVEGGGTDGRARWETTEDVTIGAGGTVDVVVEAQDEGAIEAESGEIDKVVTLITGVLGVSNAAKAAPGDPAERDDELRIRRQASVQIAGGRSLNALRANLLALDYLDAVVAIDNPSAAPATVEGVSMPGCSFLVVVYPDGLTTAQEQEIIETIYEFGPFSSESAGTDVTGTVTGLDGYSKAVSFDYADELLVDVAVVVTLEAGYVLADVEAPLEDAVAEMERDVGDPLRVLQVMGLAADIEGIASASVTLNGVAADVVPTITQLVVVQSTTVTEAP